jgi:hypothetical protein
LQLKLVEAIKLKSKLALRKSLSCLCRLPNSSMRLKLDRIAESLMRAKKLGLDMLTYYRFFHIILNMTLLKCILGEEG